MVSYSAQTQTLKVNPILPEADLIQQAAAVIRRGGLVAFPTETVYGLGANALDGEALNRIYLAKRRPASDPIIAHIHDVRQMDELAIDIPTIAYRLAKFFWPGPLTLVLKRAPHVPANIASGLPSVAMRMPSHAIARALIIAAGVPIAAPSANTFTRPSATTAEHVLEDLNGRVDVILDGGATTIGVESTVIDLTGDTPVVLRPGGVLIEHLRPIVPEIMLSPKFLDTSGKDAPSVSPGQMVKHYSPNAEVKLFTGEVNAVIARMQQNIQQFKAEGKRVGVLAADEDYRYFSGSADVKLLGMRDDLQTISHSLFAAMRMLDGLHVDVILVRDFGRQGLGAAVWDRLLRSAEGQVIDVR
ncbi:MAG: L-threonylcarbamoyladenylate synthase [Aggregatilineales bacterium]